MNSTIPFAALPLLPGQLRDLTGALELAGDTLSQLPRDGVRTDCTVGIDARITPTFTAETPAAVFQLASDYFGQAGHCEINGVSWAERSDSGQCELTVLTAWADIAVDPEMPGELGGSTHHGSLSLPPERTAALAHDVAQARAALRATPSSSASGEITVLLDATVAFTGTRAWEVFATAAAFVDAPGRVRVHAAVWKGCRGRYTLCLCVSRPDEDVTEPPRRERPTTR
ncbi:hypothetical protein LN042_04425 [Kitasatospora sp. RB6PN24]|uniref:hypothetical protein n=1 Tax=Kitasatospora humi TaxID=2893891 RepID=UPI001E46E329|nr:hypothetical protein [Kitasatospora humi]MCC9306360.1 hypothetical protein [Kitasatospora humi]